MNWRLLIPLALLAGCGGGSDSDPLPTPPHTCSIYVNWEPPTEYTGGAPLTIEDIQKYLVFVSFTEDLDAEQFSMIVEVTDAAMIQLNIRNLPAGTWFFAMKLEDKKGEVSAYSNLQEFTC